MVNFNNFCQHEPTLILLVLICSQQCMGHEMSDNQINLLQNYTHKDHFLYITSFFCLKIVRYLQVRHERAFNIKCA